MICSICGNPYTDNIASDATEIVCAICAMREADRWEKEKEKPNKEMMLELMNAIKGRKLDTFRRKYGFLQGDLRRLLGISVRQIRRYENSQYCSIDKLYKKAKELYENVRC